MLERQAYQRFLDLFAEAEATRRVFAEAGLPLPRALDRFFDESAPAASATSASPALTPGDDVRSTAGELVAAKDTSAAVELPVSAALVSTLVLSLLGANRTMRTRDLVATVAARRPNQSANSVRNLLFMLAKQGKVVKRGKGRWALKPGLRVPSLEKDLDNEVLQGPENSFNVQDLAVYRRSRLRSLLRQAGDGLTTGELATKLGVENLVVRQDLTTLKRGGAVGKAGTRWRLTPEGKEVG